MANWTTLDGLTWENRDPKEFFDASVKSSAILNRFTLYDGIKTKESKAIFKATLVFDDTMCTFSPASTADIDEKEFTTSFKRWGFQNCKDALEDTFRSTMLKKGQLNEETIDAEFLNWVFDYFVKLNGEALLGFSWSGDGVNIDGIRAELILDADVIDVDGSGVSAALTDPADILDHLELAYNSIPDTLYMQLEGQADRDYMPAIFLPVAGYKAFKLATAKYGGVEYAGIEQGLLKTYMGLEVLMYSPLATTEMLVAAPANLVMAADDFNDTLAIQTEYDRKTNSDSIWGQYKIGFSYKKGDEIIHYSTIVVV